MTQAEVDETLAPVWMERRASSDRLHARVTELRACGATWVQIGNFLGVTPQAAQQRYRS